MPLWGNKEEWEQGKERKEERGVRETILPFRLLLALGTLDVGFYPFSQSQRRSPFSLERNSMKGLHELIKTFLKRLFLQVED